jgi:polar amino acid transport system substrate-binding protein
MNTRLARVASTVSLAVALGSLAACGSSEKDSSDGGLDLIESGTLTVCSDVPYPPFEDFDKSSDSGFTGFDIEVMDHVAKALKLKLVVSDQQFPSLETGAAVNARTCDLVASAMTINPDRAKALLFSDGYFDSDQSLLVPNGSSIKTIDDLAGKKVAVQKNTTGEDYAESHAKGSEIVSFPGDPDEFNALKAKQVDAILQDLGPNQVHADAGGFTIVETYKTNEQYGFAAKKGNTALIDAINEQLDAMRADGSLEKIHTKYFPAR